MNFTENGSDGLSCIYPRPVFVRKYRRFRNGNWEDVTQHCRSYPNQN